jgi:hypothetical protein
MLCLAGAEKVSGVMPLAFQVMLLVFQSKGVLLLRIRKYGLNFIVKGACLSELQIWSLRVKLTFVDSLKSGWTRQSDSGK